MGSAIWRDLAFFGGGQDDQKNNTAVLDIFNVSSGAHIVEKLSQARAMVAGATIGDLVLFAGGELAEDESGQAPSRESKRVDIWNAAKGQWLSAKDSLSVGRKKTAAATAGGKVIFGGGYSETAHASVDTWDMYDPATDKWTHGSLSSKRMRLQSVSLSSQDGTEYALFIGGLGEFHQTGGPETCPHTSAPTKDGVKCGYTTGGLCTTVDVYNGKTGEWSFTNLTRGRYEFAASALAFFILSEGFTEMLWWFRMRSDGHLPRVCLFCFRVRRRQQLVTPSKMPSSSAGASKVGSVRSHGTWLRC